VVGRGFGNVWEKAWLNRGWVLHMGCVHVAMGSEKMCSEAGGQRLEEVIKE